MGIAAFAQLAARLEVDVDGRAILTELEYAEKARDEAIKTIEEMHNRLGAVARALYE
jgi:aerobic-type carbon monoxide dehydrogenase small subunit (CoxS/CutS family)